jgi:hypothetical protein
VDLGTVLLLLCARVQSPISLFLFTLQAEPLKIDAQQEEYAVLLKDLLRTSLKHIQQLQQPTEINYEGPYFPDSLPLSALEQLFAMTWDSCEATPELSMERIVKDVATEPGYSAPDLLVRFLHSLRSLHACAEIVGL